MLLDPVCWVLSAGTHAQSCHSVPSLDLQEAGNYKIIFSRLPCQLITQLHSDNEGHNTGGGHPLLAPAVSVVRQAMGDNSGAAECWQQDHSGRGEPVRGLAQTQC